MTEYAQPPFAEFELWNELLSIVEQHETALEVTLNSLVDKSDTGTTRTLRASVDDLVKVYELLFHGSQTLAQVRADLIVNMKELASAFDPLFLRDLFRLKLARDVIADLPSAADRARQLLDFITEANPGSTTQRYLARVARCFTWGYETESLILCRSVLEQVLEHAVPDADVFRALERSPNVFSYSRQEALRRRDPPTIADRIRAAEVLGKLTAAEVDLANTVRFRGNKAIHDAPDAGAGVIGTVRALTELIDKLC